MPRIAARTITGNKIKQSIYRFRRIEKPKRCILSDNRRNETEDCSSYYLIQAMLLRVKYAGESSILHFKQLITRLRTTLCLIVCRYAIIINLIK
ncbi:hypothetical protein C7H79_06365 [Nitrosomonas supralitoralis]|uniref:Uncharacterized protein n=1 Tax=Nitrosomonas supralitoralis TaxID=2116706 RepID=A0A2P7NW97_9PROT|nr:hypothetical protein C7H79_06365 [Nitrosomonas supralitoralis]